MVVRNAARLERGESGAGAVEVVDAPAPPPRAVVLLLAEHVLEAAADLRLVAALGGERLEGVRADVDGGRVDHGAEVAERDLRDPVLGVVGVERAPAAVPRLHPGDPVERAADGRVPDPQLAEGERDHGRVVDVRVEVVLELEGPAAGRELGPADRPVALDRDLLREQVLARLDELRVVGRHAGGTEREDGETRVPDR